MKIGKFEVNCPFTEKKESPPGEPLSGRPTSASMNLEIQEVAKILKSKVSPRAAVCRGYSLDSRNVRPNELFFAITGPNFDGHDFVASAIDRGAVGAVVSRDRFESYPESLRPLLLDSSDTIRALQKLGHVVRKRWARPLVAITGSTGKTTTKEMIATFLGLRFQVAKSLGNYNNELGLPISLVGLEDNHEVAVMELGMSHTGDIRFLAELAEPNIGVVTNVGPVHLEYFKSIDAIASAKMELVEKLNPEGVLVLNADDDRVCKFGKSYSGKVVTFGISEDADYRASNLQSKTAGSFNFDLKAEGRLVNMNLPFPGIHNVSNALAAIVVARQLDIHIDEISGALSNLSPLAQRSEIINLPKEITLINDCYNSNPLGLESMLRVLGEWPSGGQKILVVGEMLELGPTTPEWHQKLGEMVARMGQVDWLLAVQGEAQGFIQGACRGGFPGSRTHFFDEAEQAGEFLVLLTKPKDIILIKGSRDVHLEKVVERVLR